MAPLPFIQWGMDILQNNKARKKYIMLAIDYLTKWVDTKSYIQVKDIDVGIFIWKNIICHFGIP